MLIFIQIIFRNLLKKNGFVSTYCVLLQQLNTNLAFNTSTSVSIQYSYSVGRLLRVVSDQLGRFVFRLLFFKSLPLLPTIALPTRTFLLVRHLSCGKDLCSYTLLGLVWTLARQWVYLQVFLYKFIYIHTYTSAVCVIAHSATNSEIWSRVRFVYIAH